MVNVGIIPVFQIVNLIIEAYTISVDNIFSWQLQPYLLALKAKFRQHDTMLVGKNP